MQPPYNDRWERTKRYLFRNLLQDPGYCLSPIPEEARSESSDDRPYSPLPDLIIEREPNRHDDSEEFYQGLERRVKKYYKRLFMDGVDCEDYEALMDNDEDSSEFEVTKSMASTFLLEANNPKGMQREDMVTDEIIHDPENINMSDDNAEGYSKSIESERQSDSSNGERTETNYFNVSRNITELNEEVSKTIDTESDSTQTHHRILTTVAQIHEEVKRTRPIMRVFEDGSPVLLPRFYKFNKTVFGNVSDIINAVRSEKSNVLDDKEQDKIEEIEIFDKAAKKSSPNELKESSQLKTNPDPDLEVELILEGAKTVSNTTEDSRNSFEDQVTHDSEREESHDTDDLQLINDHDNEEIIDVDNNSETTSESEEEQSDKEESVGFDEFNNNGRDINDKSSDEEEIIEANKDSFEMLIRRRIFESKNKRKTSVPSTDEEIDRNQDDSEEFEIIEVMRSNTQVELHEVLRRQSSMSQEDPLVTATQAYAEQIEEDISEDDDAINASADGMRETGAELNEDMLRESAASENDPGIVVAAAGLQHAENLSFSDDFIDNSVSVQREKEKVSSKAKEEVISRSVIVKSVADVFNDTWTVSPVENNFEELHDDITVSRNHEGKKEREKKRGSDVAIDAPFCKKKKYKNIETQTSAIKKPSKSWDCIKTDLFVGSPLIFKLCGCRDHVCS